MSIAAVRSKYPPPLLSRLPCEIGPPISSSFECVMVEPSMTEALAAAHVEADDVGKPDAPRQRGAGDDAGRRTRFDELHRPLPRAPRRHDPAARLHDRDRRGDAEGLHLRLEVPEVAVRKDERLRKRKGRCASSLS